MAFCSNCGNEISDATKFCPNCGHEIGSVIRADAQNTGVSSKASSKDEITKILDYFSQNQEPYQKYDSLCQKINGYPRKTKQIFTIVTVCAFIIYFIIGSLLNTEKSEKIVNVICSGVYIAFIIYSVYFRIFKMRKIILELSEERDKAYSEIVEYYNAYGECAVGIEYTRANDLQRIADVIYSGRAKEISDAINIIIDDEHKARIERNTFAAAQNAAEAAKAAKSAARASWANFFTK